MKSGEERFKNHKLFSTEKLHNLVEEIVAFIKQI